MATIKIGDADNLKAGSQSVIRVMFNGEQVWPLSVTWVIVQSSVAVHYKAANSTDLSYIRAAGENSSYAYVTADILEYHGPNYHHTISGATLTPQPFSDSLFYIDSSHATWIRSHSLGTSPDYQQTGPSKSISFKYGGTSNAVSATIQQQTNTKDTVVRTFDTTVGFTYGINKEWLYHSGGTVTITNPTQSYKTSTVYEWTSGAQSTEQSQTVNTRTHAPDSITVSPTPQSIAQDYMSITFAANNTSQDIPYLIDASLDGVQGGTKTLQVRAIIYAYNHLQITSYYYDDIAAAGTGSGGVYPRAFAVEMDCAIDGGSPFTLSGNVSSGASSAILTGGGVSVTVAIGYQRKEGNTWRIDGVNGYVTATTRGHNIDSTHTTDTVNYPDRRVHATFDSLDSDWYSTTVYQERNQRSVYSTEYDRYEVFLSTSSSGSGSSEVIDIDEATQYVYVTGRQVYNITYSWTSNAPYTYGNSYSYPNPSQIETDPDVGSGNIEISNHRVKIPANASSDDRTFEVYGYYDGKWSEAAYVNQAGISITYGLPVVSIEYDEVEAGCGYQIWAGEGSSIPVVSFSQEILSGGRRTGQYVTGSLNEGETSGRASDGTTFTVVFSGTGANGGSIAIGGTVSIGSRGTREGSARNAATGIIAVVTSHGQSGQSNEVSAVVQQENRPYPYDAYDRYDETYINRFVILGTTATRIPQAKDTTVTVEVKAKWEHFFAGVEYTSREHTGGGSEYHDEIVTPSYLDVDGATGGYGVTSFTASNKHVESTKTYTVSAIYGGKESSDRTIDQAADYKVTGQTRNYTADISISGDLWAGGGEATITSYATHEEFSKWNSDNTEVSGSATTEYDVATVFTKSGTSSRFDLGSGTRRSDGGYDYIVTHDDMMNNAATDALVVQAKNGSNQSVTSSELRRTITNSPSSSAVYSSYYADGSAYYGNYRVDDFSVDDYDSSSSKAPSSGGAVRYSVSASHDRLRKYSRDAYYYFDSNWGSQHGGVDHNDAGHRNTVSKADSEIRVLQTYPNDSVTFSTSDSWLTVNTSTGYVIIGAQSQGGEARYGQVFAKNSGDTSSGPGYAVGIYQYGYASISTNAAGGVTFPAGGGSVNIKIYSANTTWSISYGPPDISMPSLSFVPSSGGDMDDDDMETTVRITAGRNDRPTFLMGTVTIVPDAPGLSSVTFRVSQASLASS